MDDVDVTEDAMDDIDLVEGKTVMSIDRRWRNQPESASGNDEVEIVFTDGVTLLVYIDVDGNLVAELD